MYRICKLNMRNASAIFVHGLWLFLIACAPAGNSDASTADSVTFDHEYTQYAEILGTYVVDGRVKYAELKAARGPLDRFILRLGSADLSGATREQKLSFYINAYNAITIRSIIDAYPVRSIKDIKGVWDHTKWKVAGRSLTLNDIEHKVLRKNFDEPRIHIAINCASAGCPHAMSVPYMPEMIYEQLQRASVMFTNSPIHNVIDEDRGEARISMIFDWFGDDFIADYYIPDSFAGLSKKKSAAMGFLVAHLPEARRDSLLATRFNVEYMEYSWSLNEAK